MLWGLWQKNFSARLIEGLAQYYKVTGYKPAIDLASKLTRYIRVHAQNYEPDGRPLVDPMIRSWFQAFDTDASAGMAVMATVKA